MNSLDLECSSPPAARVTGGGAGSPPTAPRHTPGGGGGGWCFFFLVRLFVRFVLFVSFRLLRTFVRSFVRRGSFRPRAVAGGRARSPGGRGRGGLRPRGGAVRSFSDVSLP